MTTATATVPSIVLPTEKSTPTLEAQTAKVLLYGAPKIGKTTLVAALDPDHTLILATEPGDGALTNYVLPIFSWSDFRQVGALLAEGDHRYTTVGIDTIDNLYKLCADDVLAGFGVVHAGDLEYGKGWAAIANEFALRLAKLSGLGLGVWMVSHAKTEEIKQRVGTLSVTAPTLTGAARKFITGFVDFIFYACSEQGADGEKRLIRTLPSENFEAGGRVLLPDPLPLDAGAVRVAMTAACEALTNPKETKAA